MDAVDVRMFTVGPVQENAYIVRASPEAKRAVLVDPGEEPERLLEAAAALGVEIEAILITHCHFDHIGAVAATARATGASVYCPEIERGVLADIMHWVPPGFGPFESYEADHTLAGGERLSLAGLEIEVIFTPGHSPGHLTYAVSVPAPAGQPAPAGGAEAGVKGGDPAPAAGESGRTAGPDLEGPDRPARAGAVLLSGDVLFQGSVGRVDLPGGDWATLERSIAALLGGFPGETIVCPGHMGMTTLGRERDTNPFLRELRVRVPRAAPTQGAAASGS
jgi:glyoxylase-like metal-dependent hydrolase (beta-lactamase superfamily II)